MKSFRTKNFILISAILLVAGVTSSCEHESDLPIEPVINSLKFDAQTKALTFEFTDGDGDVGIDTDQPPFQKWLDNDSTIPNPYYYNLWIDYFEKREGEWTLVETPGTFNYRIPVLTPKGQNKQLEVKTTYDMSFDLPFSFAQSDTIKFKVTLVDRAKHKSVPEETDAIYLPN